MPKKNMRIYEEYGRSNARNYKKLVTIRNGKATFFRRLMRKEIWC